MSSIVVVPTYDDVSDVQQLLDRMLAAAPAGDVLVVAPARAEPVPAASW